MQLSLETKTCMNPDCPDYGKRGLGNIGTRGKYGKNATSLLYCKTCGKRFSANRGTPLFGMSSTREEISQVLVLAASGKSIRGIAEELGLDKNKVARLLQKSSKYCIEGLTQLLETLGLGKERFDIFDAFVRKRVLPKMK